MTPNDALRLALARGYSVTKTGELIGPRDRALAVWVHKTGYNMFGIHPPGERLSKSLFVHRLQAFQKYGEAALAPGVVTRHLDGNRTNNHWDNIAIGSQSENMLDRPAEARRSQGTAASGARHGGSRYTDEFVTHLKAARNSGKTYKTLAAEYGVCLSQLSWLLSDKAAKMTKRAIARQA